MLPTNSLVQEINIPLSCDQQSKLRTIIEKGLPIASQPYLEIAKQLNVKEQQVLNQIQQWQKSGLIRRHGLVVKHRALGYVANAMIVWNIKDSKVDEIAGLLSKRAEISLCYRRPRRLPAWPYNLFCMIHGKNRDEVEQQVIDITNQLNLHSIEKNILFSTKAYKQHGARYSDKKEWNING